MLFDCQAQNHTTGAYGESPACAAKKSISVLSQIEGTYTTIGRDMIQAAMEILTPAQLAERLHVKPTYVYEQTRKRTDLRNADSFSYIKMGRFLRFDWNDVLEWLERNREKEPEAWPGLRRFFAFFKLD